MRTTAESLKLGKLVRPLGLILVIGLALALPLNKSNSTHGGASSANSELTVKPLSKTAQTVIEKAKLTQYLATEYKVPQTKAVSIVNSVYTATDQHSSIQPSLVLAVIAVESMFKAKASYKGTAGLMQIDPKWHVEKLNAFGGISSIYKPAVNVAVGTHILAEYVDKKKGNVRKGLLMYNGAKTNFEYPNKVFKAQAKFERVLQASIPEKYRAND